jgi:sulfate permease, SulP family
VLRLGFLAELISQPVLVGFLAGVGVSLIIGKLPGVLGIEASGTTLQKLVDTVRGLGGTNPASAVLGLGVVAMMVGGRRLPKQVPAALFAVVAFSALGVLIGAESRGVAMVGALPPGLPSLSLPTFDPADIGSLSGTAGAIALVILAQSAAVSRSFALKNHYAVDIDRDLVALAAANAGSAVSGGFAINGSPPRTAAGDAAGSRSQVVNLGMAVVIAAVLLFASGLFAYVPTPVLDGVVLGIGIHLINVPDLRRIASVSTFELGTALLALVVVAFVGVEQGVILAVVVAVVVRAAREYRAEDEVLLADGAVSPRAAERLADVPPTQRDGVVAYRFDASLFFGNAARFEERVHEAMTRVTPLPHTLVVDGGGMTEIDYTGLGALQRIAEQLTARGGRLVLTDLADPARAAIDRSGVRDRVVIVAHLEDAFGPPPAG